MKNFKMLLLTLFVSILFVPGVLATCDGTQSGKQASVTNGEETKYCDTLKAAIDDAQKDAKIKLLQDVTITGQEETNRIVITDKKLTFDFAGKYIRVTELKPEYAAFKVTGSSSDVTFIGKGGIENKQGSSALLVANGAKVTINGGEFIKTGNASDGKNYPAVSVDAATLNVEEKDTQKITITGGIGVFGTSPKLTVVSGTIKADDFAISGNGSTTTGSTIEIKGGTITSDSNAAIYHPQSGSLTITGGDISGKIGIVARGGEVKISDNAKITATGKKDETIVVGDAKDDQGKVKLPGGIGVIVDNTEKYPAGSVKATITGGEFITNEDAVLAYKDSSEAAGAATELIDVSGGKFNNDVPEKYIKAEENLGKSEGGVVGKLYKIEKKDTTNGSFTVNANAAEGETVKITVNPASGYKLDTIKVMNGDEEITVTDNSFKMPAANVKVSVTFVKVETSSSENPSESKDIVVEESSEDVTLSNDSVETLKEILENTTDEELKALLGKEELTILLENKELTKDDLTAEEKAKFESILENGTIAEYLDLSIIVKASGLADHYLKELSSLITINVKLPELPAVKEGYSRKYYVLREHDGVFEKLDATLSIDGKSLTFKSDKFSKYAIAYVDEEKKDVTVDKAPSTFDNITGMITLSILSLGVLVVTTKKVIK